jgi:hypothetical protein
VDIHRPKPIHAWKDLAKEVGIIVLGVLIALGGEQIAETLRWRQLVADQRTALKEELAGDAQAFYERVAINDCLNARISAVEVALDRSGAIWKAQAFFGDTGHREAYRAPWRSFPTQTWQNALASGVATHMPREEAQTYEAVYLGVADMHQMNTAEEIARLQLSDLERDVPLTDVSRDRYRKALDELKFYANGMARLGSEGLQLLKPMNLLPPAKDLDGFIAPDRQDFGACVKAPELR